MFTYKYPRPCVTTDCLIFRQIEKVWQLLLIERGDEPFKGSWALPGGFVEMDEDLEAGAVRELKEETGLKGIELHQFQAFGAPDRDPRARTITIVYWGMAPSEAHAKGGDDAAQARWFALDSLPALAFDHDVIIASALQDERVQKWMKKNETI